MRRTMISTSVGLFALAAGCAEPLAPGTQPMAPVHVELDERVTDAFTDFGLALFERVRTERPAENVFVSPTSAALALTMAYNGASGETRTAMAQALGVGTLDPELVDQTAAEWMNALATGDSRTELAIANSIWSREGFPFRESFLERNRNAFGAEIRELPFDDAAVRTINQWVNDQTRGKIPSILDTISAETVMFLINTVYFKGEWHFRFEEEQTRPGPFTRFDGTEVEVPMMRQSATLPYRSDAGFQMVALPYGDGRFSMVLALPERESSLADFHARLDADRWGQWVAELSETDVRISLPRFRIESDLPLEETLADLGMQVAFDPRAADFSRMGAAGLYLSSVRQKTFIEVDEVGSEAAAATSISVGIVCAGCGPPPPPQLHFDRPFFFAIHDSATQTILFMGQYGDPS